MDLFLKKQKVDGMIKFLHLEKFWFSCSKEEQKALLRYYQGGISTSDENLLIKGTISSSSNNKLKYVTSTLGYAANEKNYELFDKLVSVGEEEKVDNNNVLDAHFFFQTVAELYYTQRNIRTNALNMSIKFYQKDIELFPKYVIEMKKEYKTIPRIITFQRLLEIYENNNQFTEAISVCKLAIAYGISSDKKINYEEKIKDLERKL